MKKIFAFVLGAVLLAGLVACGSKSGQQDNAADTGADATDTGAEVADESWEKVEAAGKLVIGLDDTFAPMGFRDEAGNLVGFDIDFAEAVCEVLGVEAEFQPISWDAKEMELNSGKIDCIWNGMSITPEREESMSLTRGYLDNKIIIMTLQDVEITDKEQLLDYDITTQAKSAALEVVQSDDIFDSISGQIVEYQSYSECVMDMQSGRAEVMVIDAVAGEYMNQQLGGIFKVSEVNFGEDLYAVGFRKDDAALTARVQAAMDEVIADGGEAISQQWFGSNLLLAA